MASKSSTTKKATAVHPFYSPIIQSALQQLANQTASSQRTLSDRPVANHVDSSDDECSQSGRAAAAATDDGESESSDSDEESSDEEENNETEDMLADRLTTSAPVSINKAGNSKKSKGVKKPSNPPSIVLPLPRDENNTTRDSSENNPQQLALSIPTILLPGNYLRDNPHYDSSQVASRLLSTWTTLHRGLDSNNFNSSSDEIISPTTVIIILLQSGRFASAVYALRASPRRGTASPRMITIARKTSTRYTVRKGQGGSQSNHDSSKAPKSVGASLRREGERQLRNDVASTWTEWKKTGYVDASAAVWMSVPRVMRKEYLFDEENALLDKKDERIRSIPLDYGRATLEAVEAVMECLMRCEVGEMGVEEVDRMAVLREEHVDSHKDDTHQTQTEENGTTDGSHSVKEIKDPPQAPPYTPLHEAVIDGDLARVTELLQRLEQPSDESGQSAYDVDTRGGPEYQTPLHLASSSAHANTWMMLNTLLIQGHADPCLLDSRGRPPYYLASSDKVREAFRVARHKLGEDRWDWDSSKVGPPLSHRDIENKRIKALEKKKRQRAKQKEKKAMEAEAAAEAKREEEEAAAKLKKEEDAKRIQDGLQPKVVKGNTCDFCQKSVKKKSSMFQRLQYYYCSTDCVKRHQRELAAAAATARLGK